MIDHLIFDTTDAMTVEDTHSVGAYVRSGKSGALITHHSLQKPNAITFTFVDADVSVGNDTITETAHGLQTGDKIQLTTSGVLPAGLALLTDYYVIRVDANTIKLASSAHNAEWDMPVDITAAAGGGTHTLTGFEVEGRSLDVWVSNPSLVITDGGGSITVDAVNLDIRDLTAASDSVESWTNDGAGNPITSTSGALDVYITNSMALDVDLDGVYSGGNTDPDNVGMIAHQRGAGPLADTDQTFRSSGAQANADDVVAANVWGLDVNSFGMVFDGTNWDRLMGTGGAVHIHDGGNSITVDGSVSISGSVAVTQSTSPWVVSDAALANTAIANATNTLNVADTAEDVVASPLANRKYLWIYNYDNTKVFVGSTGVTAANGFPISPGAYLELRAGAAVDVEFVGQAGKTPEIRTLELS